MLSIVASGLFLVSGYVVNVWLGRLLGPEDFGRFGVVIALITILNLIQYSGIPQAVARFTAQSPADGPGILRLGAELQLGVALLLTFGLWASAGWVAAVLGDDSLAGPLRIGALVLPPYGLFTLLLAFHNGQRAYSRQTLTQAAHALIKVVLVIGLAYPFKIMGAVTGYILAAGAGIIVGWHSLSGRRSRMPRLRFLRHAGGLSLFAVAAVGQLNVDLLLIKALAPDAAAAGHYAAAQTVARIPYYILSGFAVLLLPAIAAAPDSMALRTTSRRAIRGSLLIALPATALLVGTARPVMTLLYSADYAVAGETLTVLGIGMCFFAISSVIASILNGLGRAPKSALSAALGAAVTVLLGVILIPDLGGAGGALATTAGTGTSLAIMLVLASRAVARPFPIASAARIGAVSLLIGTVAAVAGLAGWWLTLVYVGGALLCVGLLRLGGELTAEDFAAARMLFRRARGAGVA